MLGTQTFHSAVANSIRLLFLFSYHCTCSHYLLLHNKLPPHAVAVLVICCYITNSSRTWWFETIFTILQFLRVRHLDTATWVPWLRLSHRLQDGCQPGLKLQRGEWSASKLRHVVVGRIWCLVACWGETTLSSLPWALHRAASDMELCFIQVSTWEEPEKMTAR